MKINFKKLLLQIYFILFILLNIIDFSNLFNIFGNLGNDLDFFKKLLSWSLIGYIFYKVSLTKIFIGKRIKKYDILLIIGFSFMTITKSLVMYVINNPPQNFVIFNYFLSKIPTIGQEGNFFVLYTFLIGLIFIIILSILILKKNSPLKNSLIGSMNFSDYLKFLKFDYISLTIFSIFFGLIVFNFFMEWFALAVDSIILVAGLIYYLIKYIHNHTSGKTSRYLRNVSNTGNIFFKTLIQKFSNKKTIFVGVAFLLTLHLIVDIGVYIIPYTIGTQNTLYSNNIENQITHNSLFNILSFNEKLIESNFSKDYNNLKNEYLIVFIVFIFYLLSLFFFFFLMFMPFYIFYKNFNDSKIEIKKVFAILFLSSLVLMSILFSITEISSPIIPKMHNSLSVYGVDIQTSSITENMNLGNYDNQIFTILSLFLIYIVVLGFLLFRYSKYEIYFNKIIFIVILLFFISYISIFFISTINIELKQLKNDFSNDVNINVDNLKYKQLENIFLNETTIKDIENYSRTSLSKNYNLDIIPFYTLENFNNTHIDYFKINLFNINTNAYYYFNESYLIYINSEDYNLNTNQFNKTKSTIYLKLGENKFNLDKIGKIEYSNKNDFINKNIGNLLKYTISKKTIQISIFNYIQLFIQYLRIIFVSIFYIFGTVHFSIYYLRKNVF